MDLNVAIQVLRLKIYDSHLTGKAANKCLNVLERVEVVEWNKMVSSLPLLSCELSVSVKEDPDRKKKTNSFVYFIPLRLSSCNCQCLLFQTFS